MSIDDKSRLKHMINAAKKAAGECNGKNRKNLKQDDMFTLALIKLLEVVGEAAKGVTAEGREKYPGIPWKQMTGMRDRPPGSSVHGISQARILEWVAIPFSRGSFSQP